MAKGPQLAKGIERSGGPGRKWQRGERDEGRTKGLLGELAKGRKAAKGRRRGAKGHTKEECRLGEKRRQGTRKGGEPPREGGGQGHGLQGTGKGRPRAESRQGTPTQGQLGKGREEAVKGDNSARGIEQANGETRPTESDGVKGRQLSKGGEEAAECREATSRKGRTREVAKEL